MAKPFARLNDRRKALDSGFDAHMAKPADIDELMRVIAPVGGK